MLPIKMLNGEVYELYRNTDADILVPLIEQTFLGGKVLGIFDDEANPQNAECFLVYTPVPHPRGSNYGLVFVAGKGHLAIKDGIKTAEKTYFGLVDDLNKRVYYSAYRHDYQEHNTADGYYMVDGGGEYSRYSMPDNTRGINFHIDNGEVKEY